MARSYEQIRRGHRRDKNYYDLAYTEGFLNGIIVATSPMKMPLKAVPLYYVTGAKDQPTTFVAYVRLASRARQLHRASFDQAVRIVAKHGPLEAHHRPFLDTTVAEEHEHD